MLFRKSILMISFVVVLSVLFSCSTKNQRQNSTTHPLLQEEVTSIPTAAPLLPNIVTVEMGDRSVSQGNITLALQVLNLGDSSTVVYSLSGVDPATAPESFSPQLTNEKGDAIKLIRSDILAQLDGVQIGQFTFDAVPLGTQLLQLTLQSKEMEKPLAMTLAKIRAGPDERAGGSFYPFDYFEQGSYRISINGFGLIRGDSIALANSRKGQSDQDLENERATRAANAKNKTRPAEMPPTASPPTPEAAKLELAGGKPVVQDATLRIEEVKSGQVQYLYFVILEEGEVKAEILH